MAYSQVHSVEHRVLDSYYWCVPYGPLCLYEFGPGVKNDKGSTALLYIAMALAHIINVHMDLHRLPARFTITYNINALACNCRQCTTPTYLCDVIKEYAPSRPLRSSLRQLCKEKKTRSNRAFAVCVYKLSNQLPLDLRCISTVESFISLRKPLRLTLLGRPI